MADNSEGRKRRRVRGDGAGGGFGGQPASSAPKRRKRFLWTDDLHRMFVAAIFDHGLKACTPKLLFELMGDTPAGMTSDHIKSHLQKFRANSKISREEFLADYARALREAQAKADEAMTNGRPAFPPGFSTYPLAMRPEQQARPPPSSTPGPAPAQSWFVATQADEHLQQSGTGLPAPPHHLPASAAQGIPPGPPPPPVGYAHHPHQASLPRQAAAPTVATTSALTRSAVHTGAPASGVDSELASLLEPLHARAAASAGALAGAPNLAPAHRHATQTDAVPAGVLHAVHQMRSHMEMHRAMAAASTVHIGKYSGAAPPDSLPRSTLGLSPIPDSLRDGDSPVGSAGGGSGQGIPGMQGMLARQAAGDSVSELGSLGSLEASEGPMTLMDHQTSKQTKPSAALANLDPFAFLPGTG